MTDLRCPHCDLPWPDDAPRTHDQALAYTGRIHPPELQAWTIPAHNHAKPKGTHDEPCDVCGQVDPNPDIPAPTERV